MFGSFVWWLDGDRILLGEKTDASPPGSGLFVSASHHEGRFIVEVKGGGSQAWAETRTLLDYGGHQLT